MNYHSLKRLLCGLLVLCVILTATGCVQIGYGNFFQEESYDAESDFQRTDAAKEASYDEKLEEILRLIDRYYVDEYDEEHLGDYLAAAAVAATGDRWSYYISADEYAAYAEDNANAYVGIGVTIQQINEEDEGLTVISVTPDSPADKAGLLPQDMIVAVEGAAVKELGLTETQNRVRGEVGTAVTLTVRRDGEDFDVEILRAVIETEIVAYELMENNIGYIKINNFDSNCARDTLAALEALLAQGAAALVFDVRFNPGGYKEELVEVLDYLLPEGPLFRSVDYKGRESVDYSEASYLDIPMAVLVNDDSYSAAEFFAAALQEYGAGVVVGTKTCGKANYQQTFRLKDGSAIAISTGHYQTPNGVTLAGVGVTPDVVVPVNAEVYQLLYSEKVEKSEDEQLQAAIKALNLQ